MQEKWIGRSERARFQFELVTPKGSIDRGEVYTTRPDTLHGMSFLARVPEHPLSAEKRGSDTSLRVHHPLLEGVT